MQPLTSQPALGVWMAAMGAISIGLAFRSLSPFSSGASSESLTLAAGLVVAGLLATRFPIHIRHNTKIQMSSVPLYLAVVLLPPPLGIIAVALVVGCGELEARSRHGTTLADITTDTSRWILLALVASEVHTHLGAGTVIGLVSAAVILLAGDFLTAPVLYCPVSGESPWQVIKESAREGVIPEGCQYVVGFMGALASMQQVWAPLLLVVPTVLLYRVAKRAKEMRDDTRRLLEAMADAVDLRDPYTGGHSARVASFTSLLLTELDIHGPEAELVVSAARVHDIGKISISDRILHKPGGLAEAEQTAMREHAENGANLLARYPNFRRGVAIVRYHHETWDGCGYPHGLKRREIPLGARIVAVSDSYDAMVSDRPYRAALTSAQAISILREGAGRQWDPHVVEAFVRVLTEVHPDRAESTVDTREGRVAASALA